MAVVIERDGVDAYRYACPEGHTNWYLRSGAAVCDSCPHSRAPGSVRYDTLIDQKTGEEIDVEEVRLK